MAMAQHHFDKMRAVWSRQPMLLKLVILNVAVFLLLRIVAIIGVFSRTNLLPWIMQAVEMPSWPAELGRRPWTIVTYMFAQYDVMHLLFNMLWLYWFGVIFMSISTARRLVGLYLDGGLGGAALYLIAYNLLPVFSGVHGQLIGSSASVIAIVTATAIMWPDYRMNLLFLGSVALKWVALVTIGLDLISVTGSNAGGHIAHLGGALIGLWYGLEMRRGRDLTAPLNRLLDRVANLLKRKPRGPKAPKVKFGPKPGARPTAATASQPRTATQADQKELDRILDKIKTSGYSSLTSEEKKRLFDVSRGIK